MFSLLAKSLLFVCLIFLCTKEEVPAPVLQKFSPFFPQDLVKMMITFLSAFAHYWQPKKIEICWRQKVAITVAHCLKKVTCLVPLFDYKLQVLTIFGIFSELLSTQNVNVARFARNVNETFSVIFKHCVNKAIDKKIWPLCDNFARCNDQ